MLSKKAQMSGIPRILNLFLGLILLAGGAVGLFGDKIGISIPEGIPSIIIPAITLLGGLILLLDSFIGSGSMTQLMPKKINMPVGILIFLAGATLVLQEFSIIPEFSTPQIVIFGILLLGGFILFLDGVLGANNFST